MYSFKIHTEFKNLDSIVEEVKKQFPDGSASFTQCLGLWNGKEEKGLTIEFVRSHNVSFNKKLVCLINWIKVYNNQEAVLLTVTKVYHQHLF